MSPPVAATAQDNTTNHVVLALYSWLPSPVTAISTAISLLKSSETTESLKEILEMSGWIYIYRIKNQ